MMPETFALLDGQLRDEIGLRPAGAAYRLETGEFPVGESDVELSCASHVMASRHPLLYSACYTIGECSFIALDGAWDGAGRRLDIGGSEEEAALDGWHPGQEASPAPDVHGGLADAQAVERKRAP